MVRAHPQPQTSNHIYCSYRLRNCASSLAVILEPILRVDVMRQDECPVEARPVSRLGEQDVRAGNIKMEMVGEQSFTISDIRDLLTGGDLLAHRHANIFDVPVAAKQRLP